MAVAKHLKPFYKLSLNYIAQIIADHKMVIIPGYSTCKVASKVLAVFCVVRVRKCDFCQFQILDYSVPSEKKKIVKENKNSKASHTKNEKIEKMLRSLSSLQSFSLI